MHVAKSSLCDVCVCFFFFGIWIMFLSVLAFVGRDMKVLAEARELGLPCLWTFFFFINPLFTDEIYLSVVNCHLRNTSKISACLRKSKDSFVAIVYSNISKIMCDEYFCDMTSKFVCSAFVRHVFERVHPPPPPPQWRIQFIVMSHQNE